MTHHRCSGCKRESYPRHKYHGGLFCDHCLPGKKRKRGFFGSMWDRMAKLFERLRGREYSKPNQKATERAIYAKQKTMEARARKIPVNPVKMSPQKR